MLRKLFNVFAIVALLASFVTVSPAMGMQDVGDNGAFGGDTDIAAKSGPSRSTVSKDIKDQPNPKDYQRNLMRMRLLKEGKTAEAAALAQTGTDRVLVILVEFAGTDTFTWTAGTSTWDPLGIADPNEDAGAAGDCSKIITTTQSFTYSGPLHNEMPRPLSEADRSGDTIWTEDFSPDWFNSFMFGNGVVISYTRADSSPVYESFIGQSVADFYGDLSTNAYTVTGDVVGWLQVPHSTVYYDHDACPGARSQQAGATYSVPRGGQIPGAGNARQLVRDALEATNAISNTIPGFDWANYDQDGDGVIDRLWIVHSGYGEEDGTVLLNRTDYGESAVWSHSSSVTPCYEVAAGICAGPYIVMPENGGIGVFAHEYGHNLGAMDLYAYDLGETSAGFWTTMADDWTGYPIGFEPPAPDPMHLDWWGWLQPKVITDTNQIYEVTLGQASRFPGGEDMYRGVRIDLEDGEIPQPVPVWDGSYYWWGGKADELNSMMTTVNPIAIPAAPATTTLSFDLVYEIEDQWDFLWIQASDDGGTTWDTLTNANTVCTHDSGWIGEQNGFPADLCAAGIGGFTGAGSGTEVFDLSAYAGQNILLRMWYMTDWATSEIGAFVDNVAVTSGATTLFSDGAEVDDSKWTYAQDWIRSNGTKPYDHSFYLQWRNVNENGGYDSALGDSRWRYGPANTGLVMWYENQSYTDNEIWSYLQDFPSWGPKARMLVLDSHPYPYRDPWMVANGYDNEGGNAVDRSSMRDAPFTLADTVDFTMDNTYPYTNTTLTADYAGRTAEFVFHDALGYYPGSEFVSRGPGYDPAAWNWVTAQWDASTVMPAKAEYALKAPAYTGSEAFRFNCASTNTGRLGCYWYPGGLGYDGGSGNPAEIDAQFGWHVEVVEEAEDHTSAKVRIWNSQYAVDTWATPDNETVAPNETITYDVQFRNAGSAMSYIGCVSFDADLATYVPGSATGSPMLLASCPAEDAEPILARSTSEVGALAWVVTDADPGELTDTFTFQVEAKSGPIEMSALAIRLIDDSFESLYSSLMSKPVLVAISGIPCYLPMLFVVH